MGRAIIANGVLKDFADKDATIAQFNEYIANVQRTVPPSRVLVLRTEDGWEPLCDFLGVNPPDGISYPHKNRGNDFENTLLAAKSYTETDHV